MHSKGWSQVVIVEVIILFIIFIVWLAGCGYVCPQINHSELYVKGAITILESSQDGQICTYNMRQGITYHSPICDALGQLYPARDLLK